MAARIPDEPTTPPPAKTLGGVVVPLVLITDDWPDAKIVQLRLLFEAGLTHQLIAETMQIGKGAVSAKIGRLGWTRIENRAPQPKRPKPPLIDARKAMRLEALGAEDCRWPLTEDAQGVQLFCGARQAPDTSYCADHDAHAHRKPWGWEVRTLRDLPEPPPYAFEGEDE